MIESFRHKGLRRFYETGDTRGINAEHAERLSIILLHLDEALTIAEVDVVGLRLHALVGDLKGRWSITARANWRVTFRFEDGHASDVDLVDYH